MNRYYYISDNMDVLEELQDELENSGVDPVRIHLLTEQEEEAARHHLHKVESLAKKDLIRYGLRGAVVGAGLAALILLVTGILGLLTTIWLVPILFLAVVVLGFCTWEGGLIGAHKPNRDVAKFKDDLARGCHVFYVDLDENELGPVDRRVASHPEIRRAGTGEAEPGAVWHLRRGVRNMIRKLP